MKNPDVVLEIARNKEGAVVRLEYVVNTREEDSRSALELCEIASAMLRAENCESVAVYVDEVSVFGGVV